MPMYWTFNCFIGCIYTVYHIVYIVFLVLNWLSNLEFWLPKKEDQVARIGVMGGGLGNSGNARKKTFFFQLMSSLILWHLPPSTIIYHDVCKSPQMAMALVMTTYPHRRRGPLRRSNKEAAKSLLDGLNGNHCSCKLRATCDQRISTFPSGWCIYYF